METTIFPAFDSNLPSSILSLDQFARTRYAEIDKFNERWSTLSHDTDARAMTMFSRSIAKPSSGARTALLVEGSLAVPETEEAEGDLRKTRVVSLQSANAPSHGLTYDAQAYMLPVEADRDILELDGMDLRHPDVLRGILTVAPNLSILSLRRCQVSEAALLTISKLCPLLSKLDFSGARGLTATSLILLLTACAKLSGVRFNNCDYLFIENSVHSPTQVLDEVRAQLHSPAEATQQPPRTARPMSAFLSTKLAAGGVTVQSETALPEFQIPAPDEKQVRSKSASVLSKVAEDIKAASLASHAVTPASDASLGSNGLELASDTAIAAAQAKGFTMSTLLAHSLGAAPHRLMEISLARCTSVDDSVLQALSGQTPGLVQVDDEAETDSKSTIPDDAARARKEKMDEIRRRMGLSVADAPEELVSQTVTSHARGPKVLYQTLALPVTMHLQVLDLTACTGITDHGLAFIGANCPELRVLRLGLCDQPAVSDAGIASVAHGCCKLTTADLRACSTLTNSSVVALAKNCYRLERLCVAGIIRIDDAALTSLSSSRCAATLVDLDLTRCKSITAAAIKNLLFKTTLLGRVHTDGVVNVTMTAVTPGELAVLTASFSGVRFMCTICAETDTTKCALVPTFEAPPKEERFSNQRVFAKYGSLAAASKKAKGKKK